MILITSSSTNIQEDRIIHTEHHVDDENGANSHINSNSLNTVTNGRKDKVSRKKKASIKPKDESSSSIRTPDITYITHILVLANSIKIGLNS